MGGLEYYTSQDANLTNDIITVKTSLLHRLQAQTLPDATPPLGKIPLFPKIAVTLNQ